MKRKKVRKTSTSEDASLTESSKSKGGILCGGKSLKKSLSGIMKRQSESQNVHLLRRGIRFSSPEEFEAFIREQARIGSIQENKKKGKREKKKAHLEGIVNPGFRATPSPKRLDPNVLKTMLQKETKQDSPSSSRKSSKITPSQELRSSRFRYINEKLYTQSGSVSKKMFSEDPDSFQIYHEGYAQQIQKWPLDPLDCIVSSMMRKSEESVVVVDMGCGEARLARLLPSHFKVHSFDFIALNESVTPCDMAKTPMDSASADVVVFCLSLMGTNIKDYLKEANRILKMNGTLKIAEVESRFRETTAEKFIQVVEKMGFKLKWKDLSKKIFYLMDFKKTQNLQSYKLPQLSLKPCIYKKR